MGKENLIPEIRFEGFQGGWIESLVGSHYYFKNGLNKGKEFFGYGSPIVNFTDVFHNRTLYSSDINGRVYVTKNEIINNSVYKGDILFTRTSETLNEIGFPSVIMDEQNGTVFSGFLLRARARDIDPLQDNFKSYVFFADFFRNEMINKSSISTRALTSGTSISKMRFCYPIEIEEQDRIGSFFMQLDKSISIKGEDLRQLQNFKQAMLQKMFPKEGEKEPEVRFVGFEGEWSTTTLGKLMDITTGALDANEANPTGKYKFFTTSEKILRINYYNFVGPAITLAGNGVMGNSTYVPNGEKFNAYQRVYVLTQSLNKNWYQFIRLNINQYLPQTIRKKSSGSVISYITKDILEDLEIKLPTLEEQIKVSNYFETIDTNIISKQKELTKLKQFKQAMLNKMFV